MHDREGMSYLVDTMGLYLMKAKPKAAPAGSSSTSSSAKPPSTPAPDVAQTPAPPNAPAPASSSTPNPPTTPTPNAPSLGASNADDGNFNDPSALTLGAQRVAAVSNMESMGFPRADIDRAMRAAFFNPDRAVEYLLNVSHDVVTHI